MNNQDQKKSFRDKCKNLFTSKPYIISFLLVISVLMLCMDNIGQLSGLFMVVLILWSTKWDLGYFGWYKMPVKLAVVKALTFTLVIILIVDVMLTPMLDTFIHYSPDLENFQSLKGDPVALLISILIMWVIAAIGEELLFRGLMIKQLAVKLGNSKIVWLAVAFTSSLIFGFAHTYQGISGIITASVVAIILALVLVKNPKHLLVCILTHGFYDTFGLTMIYLNKENLLTEFMQQYIFAL